MNAVVYFQLRSKLNLNMGLKLRAYKSTGIKIELIVNARLLTIYFNISISTDIIKLVVDFAYYCSLLYLGYEIACHHMLNFMLISINNYYEPVFNKK